MKYVQLTLFVVLSLLASPADAQTLRYRCIGSVPSGGYDVYGLLVEADLSGSRVRTSNRFSVFDHPGNPFYEAEWITAQIEKNQITWTKEDYVRRQFTYQIDRMTGAYTVNVSGTVHTGECTAFN